MAREDGGIVHEPAPNQPAPAYLKTKIIIPQRQVRAMGGDLVMRCGRCGHMNWQVHVRPVQLPSGEQRAGPTFVVCMKCAKHYKIDDTGLFESKRKTGVGDLKKEENL